MELAERAYEGLFEKKNEDYIFKITYSSKFKAFNANAKLKEKNLTFSLSRDWKTIDEDIVIGLIQELMIRLLTRKKQKPKSSMNIDLYNHFIKGLHISVPKTKSHPILDESFERVNLRYFYGMVEKPNLEFKGFSERTLGSYNYQTDTISLSGVFENAEQDIIDYIMYHEMLHKKLKYHNKNGRGFHHTSEFKKKEKEFENSDIMEKKASEHIRTFRKNKKKILLMNKQDNVKKHDNSCFFTGSFADFLHRKLFK